MSKARIRIKIKGEKGAGKSTLLHEIGSFLAGKGYNVQCTDCGRGVSPHSVGGRPDQRIVQVVVDET